VDVSKQEGKTLADAPRAMAVTQTQVYSSQDDGAEAEVRRVIAMNSGSPHQSVQGGPPAKQRH
jgi:membrane fusion protein, multidrug efflux system